MMESKLSREWASWLALRWPTTTFTSEGLNQALGIGGVLVGYWWVIGGLLVGYWWVIF
jgi:hypothetical protein